MQERMGIASENKYVHNLFERFSKLNGKAPKLAKTPCSTTPMPGVTSDLLSHEMSAEYRSLVGLIMHVSQERFDIQFAAKSLAANLKNPNKTSWLELASGWIPAVD